MRAIGAIVALLFAGSVAGLTCLTSGCASVASTGSVYRGRCTHIGVRPASDGAGDYALTVRVTTDAPVCPEVVP